METLKTLPTIDKLPEVGKLTQLPSLPTITKLPTVDEAAYLNKQKQLNERNSWYSDATNPTQITSLLDVVDHTIDPADNGGNAFKAFKYASNEWLQRHFIKPIEYKSWAMFGNNMLEGFGEDMDVFANIVKASYSPNITSGKNYGYAVSSTASRRIQSAIGLGVKGRYNYDADTGNTISDLLLETVSDPLNVVEAALTLGTAPTAKSGLKASAKASKNMFLDDILKLEKVSSPELIKDVFGKTLTDEALEKAMRNKSLVNAWLDADDEEFKSIFKSIIRSQLNESETDTKAYSELIKALTQNEQIDSALDRWAEKVLQQAGVDATDRVNITLLRELNRVNNFADKVDKGILYVAGAPFTPIIPLAKKFNIGDKIRSVYSQMHMQRSLTKLMNEGVGVDLTKFKDAAANIKQSVDELRRSNIIEIADEDVDAIVSLYNAHEMLSSANTQVAIMNKIIANNGSLKSVSAIDEAISKYTNGTYTKFSDYKTYVTDTVLPYIQKVPEYANTNYVEEISHNLECLNIMYNEFGKLNEYQAVLQKYVDAHNVLNDSTFKPLNDLQNSLKGLVEVTGTPDKNQIAEALLKAQDTILNYFKANDLTDDLYNAVKQFEGAITAFSKFLRDEGYDFMFSDEWVAGISDKFIDTYNELAYMSKFIYEPDLSKEMFFDYKNNKAYDEYIKNIDQLQAYKDTILEIINTSSDDIPSGYFRQLREELDWYNSDIKNAEAKLNAITDVGTKKYMKYYNLTEYDYSTLMNEFMDKYDYLMNSVINPLNNALAEIDAVSKVIREQNKQIETVGNLLGARGIESIKKCFENLKTLRVSGWTTQNTNVVRLAGDDIVSSEMRYDLLNRIQLPIEEFEGTNIYNILTDETNKYTVTDLLTAIDEWLDTYSNNYGYLKEINPRTKVMPDTLEGATHALLNFRKETDDLIKATTAYEVDGRAWVTAQLEGLRRSTLILNGALAEQLEGLFNDADVALGQKNIIQQIAELTENVSDYDGTLKALNDSINELHTIASAFTSKREFITQLAMAVPDSNIFHALTASLNNFGSAKIINLANDPYEFQAFIATSNINALMNTAPHSLALDYDIRYGSYTKVHSKTMSLCKKVFGKDFGMSKEQIEDIANLVAKCGHRDSTSDVYATLLSLYKNDKATYSNMLSMIKDGKTVVFYDLESSEDKLNSIMKAMNDYDTYELSANPYKANINQITALEISNKGISARTFILQDRANEIANVRNQFGVKAQANLITSGTELGLLNNFEAYLKNSNTSKLIGYNNHVFDDTFMQRRWKANHAEAPVETLLLTKSGRADAEEFLNAQMPTFTKLLNDGTIDVFENVKIQTHTSFVTNKMQSKILQVFKNADLNNFSYANVEDLNAIDETIESIRKAYEDYKHSKGNLILADGTDAIDDFVKSLSDNLSNTRKEINTFKAPIAIEDIFNESMYQRVLVDGTTTTPYSIYVAKHPELTEKQIRYSLEHDKYFADSEMSWRAHYMYDALHTEGESYDNFLIRMTNPDGATNVVQPDNMPRSIRDLLNINAETEAMNIKKIYRPTDIDAYFFVPLGTTLSESQMSNLKFAANKMSNTVGRVRPLTKLYREYSNIFENQDELLKFAKGLRDLIISINPNSPVKYLNLADLNLSTTFANEINDKIVSHYIGTESALFSQLWYMLDDTPNAEFVVDKKVVNLKDAVDNYVFNYMNTYGDLKNSINPFAPVSENAAAFRERLKTMAFKSNGRNTTYTLAKTFTPDIDLLQTKHWDTVRALDRTREFESIVDTLHNGNTKTYLRRLRLSDAIAVSRHYDSLSREAKTAYESAMRNVWQRTSDLTKLNLIKTFTEDPKELARYIVLREPHVHFSTVEHGIYSEYSDAYKAYISALSSPEFIAELDKYGIEFLDNQADGFDFRLKHVTDDMLPNTDNITRKKVYMGVTYEPYTANEFKKYQIAIPDINEKFVRPEDVKYYNDILNDISTMDMFLGDPKLTSIANYDKAYKYYMSEDYADWYTSDNLRKAGYFEEQRFSGSNLSLDNFKTYGYWNGASAVSDILSGYQHYVLSDSIYDLAHMLMTNGSDGMDLLADTGHFFSGLTDDEILQVLNSSDSLIVCGKILDNSTQGYHLEALTITNKTQLQMARQLNAVLMPYQVYTQVFDALNNNARAMNGFLNNKLLKGILYTYKISYLMWPGTWLRNIIDSNLKAMIDTEDPTGMLKNTYLSMKYRHSYNEAILILKEANVSRNITNVNISEIYDNPIYHEISEKLNAIGMDKQTFFMIKGFISDSESNGEVSAMLKWMKEDAEAFASPTVYDTLVDGGSQFLRPMGGIEANVRLAQYLTLMEQGVGATEAFKRISATAFDYSIKSNTAKMLEYIIPFYNFQKLNLLYWINAIAENPTIMKFIDDYMGAVENTYDLDPYMYDPESYPYYQGSQYHIQNGNPILKWENADNSETGLVLKLNPSYMDMINFFTNPKEKVLGSLLQPIQNLAEVSGELYKGAEFDNAMGLQYAKDVLKKTANPELLPVANVILQRYLGTDSTGYKNAQRLQKPAERIIGRVLPDVFGSVQRWENFKENTNYFNYPRYYSSNTYRQQFRPEANTNYYRKYYRAYRPKHSKAYWYAIRVANTPARYQWDVTYY